MTTNISSLHCAKNYRRKVWIRLLKEKKEILKFSHNEFVSKCNNITTNSVYFKSF